MEALIAAIAVAVIGGPLMWALKRIDDRNAREHSTAHQERMAVAQAASDVAAEVKTELNTAAEVLVSRFDALDAKLATHDTKLDKLNDLVIGHLAFHAHTPANERQLVQ